MLAIMLTLYLMKDNQEGYHVDFVPDEEQSRRLSCWLCVYLMKNSQEGYHVDFVPDEG